MASGGGRWRFHQRRHPRPRRHRMGVGGVNVLPGNGDGTFDAAITKSRTSGTRSRRPTSTATASSTSSPVTGRLKTSACFWAAGTEPSAPPAQPGAGYGIDGIVVGDFNRDTRPDVAIADYLISGVDVLLNDGNWATKTYIGPASGGNWSTASNWTPPACRRRATWSPSPASL